MNAMPNYRFSDKARAVLHYLQDNPTEELLTYRNIADAVGETPRSTSCTITGLVKKGLVVREEVPELAATVKNIRLTDEGLAVDADELLPDEE